MNRMIVRSRVGSDGVLRLAMPFGNADADREVQVTIDPVTTGDPAVPCALTQDEWRNFIQSTAGSITDPSFRRHEQGNYERREEFP